MRKQYELTNPKSCMSKAREDEMTFVLLGRDPAAPSTIRYWAGRRVDLGLNRPEDEKLAEAKKCAEIMEAERAFFETLPLSSGSPPEPTQVPASIAERLDVALRVTEQDVANAEFAMFLFGGKVARIGLESFVSDVRPRLLALLAENTGIPGPPTVDDGDLDVFETACQDEPVYFGTETRAVARRILEAFVASRHEEFGSVPPAAVAASEPEPDGPKTDPAPEQPEDAVVTVADRFASAIKPLIEGVLGLFGFLRRGGR